MESVGKRQSWVHSEGTLSQSMEGSFEHML